MKLVIYGINEITEGVINSVISSNEIVAISDSFLNVEMMYNYPFVKKNEIALIEYDYIIVCVKKRNTFDKIKDNLIVLGIMPEKILSFYNMYYEARIDQVMLKAQKSNTSYDGIIIGISHAAYAINPKYLDGEWANLSVPSEDLTNHNYVIDKLVSEYKDQIEGIKTVIIDLYDYSVLNFVTSLSRYNVEFYDLFCGDGIEQREEFMDLENEILRRNNYSSSYARKYRQLRQKLFNEEKVFSLFSSGEFTPATPIQFFYKDCVCCEDEIELLGNEESFIPRIQHDENVSMNINQLVRLTEKVVLINPDIRIVFVLIPRIANIEMEMNPRLNSYKRILMSVLDELQKKSCNISLLDYKGVNEISLYKEGYCSIAHMNVKGQRKFSKILNRDMRGI